MKRLLAFFLIILLSVGLFCSCTNDLQATGSTESTVLENPIYTGYELAWAKEMTYTYFFPAEDGSITSATYTEQLNEGKSSETMQSHMDRFFGYCGIYDITVVESKVEGADVTEYKEFGGETIVTHTPSKKTLVLTLEGETELSEKVKECLIETLEKLSYCKYFKVIYNGKVVYIDGAMAEN